MAPSTHLAIHHLDTDRTFTAAGSSRCDFVIFTYIVITVSSLQAVIIIFLLLLLLLLYYKPIIKFYSYTASTHQSAHSWRFKSFSPAVGWHYFPSGLRSPSQPKNVTVLQPVPSDTAWWQKHIGVNNFPKVVTQLCPSGNWTHDLLIARSMPYHYTTVSTIS